MLNRFDCELQKLPLIYRVLIWSLINEISSDWIRHIARSTFSIDDLFILDIPICIDGESYVEESDTTSSIKGVRLSTKKTANRV